MTLSEHSNSLLHILTSCSHPALIHAREQAIYSLGERLYHIGSPNWWTLPPSQLTLNPPFDIDNIPSPPHEPLTVLPPETYMALFVRRQTSIPLPSLRKDRPRHLAAPFLLSLAFQTAISPDNPITSTLVDSLPSFITPEQCAQILHPAFIDAALDVYSSNTGVNAFPPYLDPRLRQHLTTHPSSLLPSIGAETVSHSHNLLGTISSVDPHILTLLDLAATRSSTCLLLIQGPLLPSTRRFLEHSAIPAEIRSYPPNFFPQPHAELLEGSHGFTRSTSTRLNHPTTWLRYGPGPALDAFLSHPSLRPHLLLDKSDPLHHPPAPPQEVFYELGHTLQWFIPPPSSHCPRPTHPYPHSFPPLPRSAQTSKLSPANLAPAPPPTPRCLVTPLHTDATS